MSKEVYAWGVFTLVRDYISRSHQRCSEMDLDPAQQYSSMILRDRELEQRLEENNELMQVAAPFMEQLHDYFHEEDFIVILNDRQGVILKVIGNTEMQAAEELLMVPGASMNERHFGTNAMGTAIAEGRPVQVSGSEHFVESLHRWTCSGSPIRDRGGNIIGVLDMSGQSHLVHSHTLGMVVAAAQAIEYMLDSRAANSKLVVAGKYIQTIIDSIDAGIFTVGPRGFMKLVNKKAEAMLGYTQKEVEGMRIESFIDGWNLVKETLSREHSYYEEEFFIRGSLKKLHCTLSVYYIKDDEQGRLQGFVCVIKEIKQIRKLVHKISGKQSHYTFDSIIGANPKFLRVVDMAKEIADSPSTVLITGESGTGKEIFAQSIHNASRRRDEPFVAINCGALPRTLIESELFGYAEGAFTGAQRGGRPGKFELADGGTLFLDEIGEMPLDMQANLLRVLEEGKLYRVGGNKIIEVDVRIIAATNKDLRQEVEQGNFRRDLFYRLNVLRLQLPPLRERKEDIPILVDYFISTKASKLNKVPMQPKDYLLNQLCNHHWPGNIRELENVIESMLNAPDSVPPVITSNSDGNAETSAVEIENLAELEQRHILRVLDKYNGNVSSAAKALGIGRNTLYRKLNRVPS